MLAIAVVVIAVASLLNAINNYRTIKRVEALEGDR